VLNYWHTGTLIKLSLCRGIIVLQLSSIFLTELAKVECSHLTYHRQHGSADLL